MTLAIREQFGGLDYLINNIERGGMPVVHGSYDHGHNTGQWDLEISTTLTAKWLLYHHCLPLMRGVAGRAVVNISSVAAITGRSGAMAALFNDGYSAANRAVSVIYRDMGQGGCSGHPGKRGDARPGAGPAR